MRKNSHILYGKVFFAAIGVILITAWSYGAETPTWVQQNSTVKQTLNYIYFTDTMCGWAVGNHASVVRTVNGGATWTPCTFPGTDSLWVVVFQDPAKGWMSGNQTTIYVSSDSGKTWTAQFSQPQTGISDAWVLGPGTVVFSGATAYNRVTYAGMWLRTTNGGVSWTQTLNTSLSGMGDLCFVTPSKGWAAEFTTMGSTVVSATVDSGKSWGVGIEPLPGAYRGYVNTIWFVDSMKGFGTGRYGGFMTTADGGATWSVVDTSQTIRWYEDMEFSDPAHGIAAGQLSVVTYTADSGKTWTLTYPRTPPYSGAPWFRHVFTLDKQHWWLAGDSGVIMRGGFFNPTVIKNNSSAMKPTPQVQVSTIKFAGNGPICLQGNYGATPVVEIFRLDGTLVDRAMVCKIGDHLIVTIPHKLSTGVHVMMVR